VVLAGMGLGVEGGVTFGRALERRVPIRSLDLWSNGIGPAGAASLAKGIFASGHLHTLSLKV
jgi:hypothetical protein